MNTVVQQLFHALADLSPEARARYFEEYPTDDQTRREVEELLAFDSDAHPFFTKGVALAASSYLSDFESQWRCGPYRLLSLIGRGGMGAVYLAERADGEVAQRVAVKLLPAGAGHPQRERFLQERQILASLAHPNIARMLDAGHLENGTPFLAMEFVDGKPIDVFCAGLTARQKTTLFLKVCAAVAYLHRNLVVHRDLKPSNILVTGDGEPKLLDFGIAKMLDAATDLTITSMRLLTPDYASPEQVVGGPVTTATDIYSLGAVLYQLLTGKPPHEFDEHSPEAVARSITTREPARPSKRAPELKGDLESILLKALRKDPHDRYGTVEQFAEDLQAFLQSRSVRARSGNAWYRVRKFVRRSWLPVGAASLVIASLSVGLYVANRERAVAQRRFDQVRQLAGKVLGLDAALRALPGSTRARSEIVAISQQYLEGLASEVRADQNLALEVAQAYFVLARVQGLPTGANLGQFAQADLSLQKADALLEPILKKSPHDRKALLLSADVANGRMILADDDHRPQEALAEARLAAANLDTLLGRGQASAAEIKTAFLVFNDIALAFKNEHQYGDSIRYARRSAELARAAALPDVNPAQPLSILADSLRFSGDLPGALNAIREARAIIEKSASPDEIFRLTQSVNVLWREGTILGQDGNVSLDRPAEAAEALQKAFDLSEQWAAKDPQEARTRILIGTAARELGLILAHTDPQRALAVYDKALFRLRQIKGGSKPLRDETRLLAYSSYVLRQLHRPGEARERIDDGFRLLRQTKDYPADRIDPHQEAAAVLRAWADHLAETGQPQGAAQVYQELLDKIMAFGPDPQNDLRDAARISSLYEAMATLDRRLGHPANAEALEIQNLNLWRQWDHKLPNNSYVLRQLAASGVH